MKNIEEVIRQKIAASVDQSLKTRALIYRAAANVIEKLPEHDRTFHRQQLKKIILDIEREFTDLASENDIPTGMLSPHMSETKDQSELADNLSEGTLFFIPSMKNKSLTFVGIGLIALFLAVVSFLFLFDENANQNDLAENAGKEARQGVEDQSTALGVDETIFDLNFSNLQSGAVQELSTRVARKAFGMAKLSELVRDGGLTLTEDLTFFAGPNLKVDTTRVYSMQVEILKSSAINYRPVIGIGFVTFDEAGRIQRAAPGPFRNFVHHGKLNASEILEVDDSWVVSGVITGEGNQSHNYFRIGTKTVRAVFKISPQPGKPVVIRRITLRPIT